MKWINKLFPHLCKHKKTETNGRPYSEVVCTDCDKVVGHVNVKGKTVLERK